MRGHTVHVNRNQTLSPSLRYTRAGNEYMHDEGERNTAYARSRASHEACCICVRGAPSHEQKTPLERHLAYTVSRRDATCRCGHAGQPSCCCTLAGDSVCSMQISKFPGPASHKCKAARGERIDSSGSSREPCTANDDAFTLLC